MIDNLSKIFQQQPTGETPSTNIHSRGTIPFKLQVNFDIPIFEDQIDVDVIDRWLNLFEGYFSIHEFSGRENITFTLLKSIPHVKDWWETCYEQKDKSESSLFSIAPTWNSFRDAIKELYYAIESYEDNYIKWTTLRHGRDQDVPEFTNIFHTLRTEMSIKDSKQYLVLKYCSHLHNYI